MQDKDSTQRVFLAKVSRTLNPIINFVFISVILAVFVDIVANTVSPIIPLPQLWLNHLRSAFEWSFQNPISVILLFLILFLLRFLFFLVRDVEIPPSQRKLLSDYLHSVKVETEMLIPEGLPTYIRGRSALLKTIFSSPDFYPNTPMTNFLLIITLYLRSICYSRMRKAGMDLLKRIIESTFLIFGMD